MNNPRLRTNLIFGLSAVALVLVFQLAKGPVQKLWTSPAAQTITVPKSASTQLVQPRGDLPSRLIIPVIGVDARIEYLGLTSDGVMAVTPSLINVTWYKLGQRPGEKGSAVIAGHFGGKSLAAVFNNLHKLKVGDKVLVRSVSGTSITFVVRGLRNYDPNADASSVFLSSDGKAHLNLITCEGVWNKATKSYSQRLVVYTDKM